MTAYKDVPICPWCDAPIWRGREIEFPSTDEIEINCGTCEKPMLIMRHVSRMQHVSVTYSTFRCPAVKHDPNTLTRGLPKGAI